MHFVAVSKYNTFSTSSKSDRNLDWNYWKKEENIRNNHNIAIYVKNVRYQTNLYCFQFLYG